MTDDGDYEPSAGGYAVDRTQASNVRRHLTTRYGSVPSAPRFGNRMFRVKKITPDAARAAEQAALDALSPMITDGRIFDVQVLAKAESKSLVVTVTFNDETGQGTVRHRIRS